MRLGDSPIHQAELDRDAADVRSQMRRAGLTEALLLLPSFVGAAATAELVNRRTGCPRSALATPAQRILVE